MKTITLLLIKNTSFENCFFLEIDYFSVLTEKWYGMNDYSFSLFLHNMFAHSIPRRAEWFIDKRYQTNDKYDNTLFWTWYLVGKEK